MLLLLLFSFCRLLPLKGSFISSKWPKEAVLVINRALA